ncbi:unnamed protein product [Diamesa serratosioi]
MEKNLVKRPGSQNISSNIKIKEEPKDEDDLKEEKALEALISKQSKQFFSHRVFLEKYSISELQDFLNLNGSGKVLNKDNLLDRAADFLTFGVIDKCNQCNFGDFEFKKNGYKCNGKLYADYLDYLILNSSLGDVSEWAKCEHFVEKPQRHKPVLPDNWKDQWNAWNFEPIVQDRAVRPYVMKFAWTKDTKSIDVTDSVIDELIAGSVVDPKSKMETNTCVFRDGSVIYSVVLTLTDIQRNKNSYYKIQLLEEYYGRKYHVFTSWGRIGTQNGGSAIKTINDVQTAVHYFEDLYEKKTQNSWSLNGTTLFQKKPGCYVPIEIQTIESKEPLEDLCIPSKLPAQLQELIKMMFDVNSMKRTMKDFMLDLNKMAPGRLKRKPLEDAYQCLGDLYRLVENGGRNVEFIGLSNKFYSLIPHAFGNESIPIIDTQDTIKAKADMIESLLEIEIAQSLMNAERYDAENPLDFQYAQLMTQLTPLERTNEDFKLIEKYLQNTHGDTHTDYRLEIQDVFRVNRFGENKRYEKWQVLNNRMLLWHGSRLTNFVGILSHGLKIAPPDAPHRGDMFGKGIYFADMVTKSANYCNPDQLLTNTSGLLLLCQVALGQMQNLFHAKRVTTLPRNIQSVKGVGCMFPNPCLSHRREDGVVIPLAHTTITPQTQLLYNEYVVYDESQVKIEYLLKVFFKPH